MNNNFHGLTAAVVAPWVANSFPIIRIILVSLLILLCVSVVVLILMQPAKQEGVGAISGAADTFFSKNKGRSREGMLLRLTIILCIVAFVVTLVFHITLSVYSPKDPFGSGTEASEALIRAFLK